MRRTQIVCAVIVLILALVFALHAQDSIVIVTAQAQGLNLVSPSDLPDSGTFWLVSSNGVTAPLPCPPEDASLPVFQITDSEFIVDATGGLVATDPDQSVEDAVAALANDVQNLIAQIQGAVPSRNLSRGGAHAMDDPDPLDPDDGGDGDTNIYMPNVPPPFTPTTNDLWLQIIGATNYGTNLTAYLVIHPPWNVTNGVWGLYFTTNIAIPYDNWTWLLRNAPGRTNLVVTNLPALLGFFMLGPPTAIRDGFTNNLFVGVDDESVGPIDLLFTANFFGTSNSTIYVNENGNITFNGPFNIDDWDELSYDPYLSLSNAAAFTGLNIVAPFWADVDTRPAGSGLVGYGTNTVDGHAAFGVSWINVGYYVDSSADPADKTNSFQVIIINRPDRASGDYDIEFNYSQIQWESGNADPGSSNGLGGDSARVGFASTNNVSGSSFEINGSGTNSALLDTNLMTGLIYTNFNSNVPGRYDFQFHAGAPIALP